MSDSTDALDQQESDMWICETCGFIYDPREGDPDGGIDAGTPFEQIPDDWVCPLCGARKCFFRKLEPGDSTG